MAAARPGLFGKLAALLLSLALCEAALQVAALVSPRFEALITARAWKVRDPVLGHRLNPAYPGHDRTGFRNASVPSEVALLALGDSMTYGQGASREEAWPQAAGRLAGISVYNMGVPGWCPIQAIAIWDEVLERRPKLVVAAFYAGNDAFDAYRRVYGDERWKWLRTADPAAIAAIRAAEEKGPLTRKTSQPKTIDRPLSRYFRLYGLVQAIRDAVRMRGAKSRYPTEAFDDPRTGTLFTPAARLLTSDLAEPRIAEGFRLCLEAFGVLDERSRKAGARLLVVLIPNKERAYRAAARASGAKLSEDYWRLVEREDVYWARAKAYFDGRGIRWCDSLPALEQAVAAGERCFPATWDAHPTAAGYLAIARSVVEAIRADPALRSAASIGP
jgi:lysophospholipase L1-like esterase